MKSSPFFLGAALGLVLSFTPACGKAKEACDSTNCSGCCDINGTCQLGGDNVFCGTAGNVCQSCTAGTGCRQGLCLPPVSAGGGGGSTTGGGGGATGGGGGVTGGGTGGGVTGGGTGGGVTGGGTGGGVTGGGTGGGVTGGGTGGGVTGGGTGGGVTGGGTGGGGGGLPTFTSQLWYFGRVSTTTRNEIGRVFFPSRTQQALSVPGSDIRAWDVASTGRLIAMSADTTVTGRFDLVVMNHDGTGLRTLGTPPAGAGVNFIRFSPNNQRVMFETKDASGLDRLFVVNVTGGAAIDVTPQGANLSTLGLNIINTTFSRDSRYLAIVVEATQDRVNELYVVDFNQPSPTPVARVTASTIGAPGAGTTFWGVTSPVQWSAASRNELLFKYRTTTDPVCAGLPGSCPFRLMRVLPSGGTFAPVPGTPDGISMGGWAGSFGISNDGLSIAFSADTNAAQTYDLYTVSLVSGGPASQVHSATLGRKADFNRPIVFSPSNNGLIFAANYEAVSTSSFEPYALPLPSGPAVRLTAFTSSGLVDDFQFSPSAELSMIADWRTFGTYELALLPSSTTPATPVPLVTPVAGGDVLDAEWTP